MQRVPPMTLSPQRFVGFACACALAALAAVTAGSASPARRGGIDMPVPDAQGNLPYVAPQPVAAALPARAWRLTHAEYRKSVMALTGVAVDTNLFEPEADGGLFVNLSNVNFVRVQLAGNYQNAAEEVSDAMTNAQLLALATPCTTLTAACKADFIRNTLTRAYRRAPSADETAEAGQIFDLGGSTGDPVFAFRAVIQSALTSPFFLYRTEIGARRRRWRSRVPHHRPGGRDVPVVQPARPAAPRGAARGRRSRRADQRVDAAHQRRRAAGDARGRRAAARLPVPVADADQGQRRALQVPRPVPRLRRRARARCSTRRTRSSPRTRAWGARCATC